MAHAKGRSPAAPARIGQERSGMSHRGEPAMIGRTERRPGGTMPKLTVHSGEIYYEEHGAGPPLLLVSGLGGLASYWRPQLPALTDRFQVIVHDHRGTGQSEKSRIRYSVEQMAADVVGLMDGLSIPFAHVLGHSTGGAIGQL